MRFYPIVTKSGSLQWETPHQEFRWKMWCESHPGLEVVIEHKKGKRTLRANAYYWLVLGAISEATGHDTDELHRIFKGRFLPPKIVVLGGKEYKLARSTTELDTSQFAEYVEKVVAEGASLGLILPTRSEAERLDIQNL